MKALFLFSILFVFTKQQGRQEMIIPNSSITATMKTMITQSVCTVRLRTPMSNDVLSQSYIIGDKLESNWRFSWIHCQDATKYHLYVIGPRAAISFKNYRSRFLNLTLIILGGIVTLSA